LLTMLGRRNHGKAIDLASSQRILVIRLDDIGDMVLSTPLIRGLRDAAPAAFISLVVKPSVFNLVEHCPHVDEILTYDPGPLGEPSTPARMRNTLGFTAHHLWRRRFDVAVVPRWDADLYHATFMAYWSGALWRIGYSEQVIEHKRVINRGYDRLFSHVLCTSALKHEVERGLDVLRFMGARSTNPQLELWPTAQDERSVLEFLQSHGATKQDMLVALGPGAASETRRWSPNNFIELGKWLQKWYQARIVIVGGAESISTGQTIQQSLGAGVINAVGATTLRELGVLLKSCALYIGNDSAPMHMAAAVRIPVVEISCHPKNGNPQLSNSPVRFGPWGVVSAILQPENGKDSCREACTVPLAHCIHDVEVGSVQEAVKACLLQAAHPAMNSSAGISPSP
jgi:heptosyltransferase-2